MNDRVRDVRTVFIGYAVAGWMAIEGDLWIALIFGLAAITLSWCSDAALANKENAE